MQYLHAGARRGEDGEHLASATTISDQPPATVVPVREDRECERHCRHGSHTVLEPFPPRCTSRLMHARSPIVPAI